MIEFHRARVIELRKRAKLSQEQFGKRIGVTRDAVAAWEQGKNLPTREKFSVIAEVLGVDPSEIYSDLSVHGESRGQGVAPTLRLLTEGMLNLTEQVGKLQAKLEDRDRELLDALNQLRDLVARGRKAHPRTESARLLLSSWLPKLTVSILCRMRCCLT